MKRIYLFFMCLSLIFLVGCIKKEDWSRNYNIETEGNIRTGALEKSNYPCKLDNDCKDFCYDLGNRGVISYSSSCQDNFCVCSAPPYAD